MPQPPTSYFGQWGHQIFASLTLGIGLGLSVIFPLCFQTIRLYQTPVLPPTLN